MTASEGGATAPSSRTLADLSAELDMRVELIPVDLIDPDPENPNEMTDATMEALREEIRRGFLQPVLVRAGEDGRWKMVDGEHRWLIVKEEGYGAIPSVVMEGDEDEARIRLLTMNRLRGQLVPIKVAYLLADLAKRIPEKDLRRRLGMDEAEFADTLRLTTFTDDIAERLREGVDRESRESPVTLTFVCSERDAVIVTRAVEAAKDGKLDNGQALTKIARAWEKSR